MNRSIVSTLSWPLQRRSRALAECRMETRSAGVSCASARDSGGKVGVDIGLLLDSMWGGLRELVDAL
jgi:hypothetical protein